MIYYFTVGINYCCVHVVCRYFPNLRFGPIFRYVRAQPFALTGKTLIKVNANEKASEINFIYFPALLSNVAAPGYVSIPVTYLPGNNQPLGGTIRQGALLLTQVDVQDSPQHYFFPVVIYTFTVLLMLACSSLLRQNLTQLIKGCSVTFSLFTLVS